MFLVGHCVGIAESGEGPKAVLGNLLSQANKPLTSGEIWESVENKGFKSKRYMKQMLKQMRLKGHINTKPLPASGKKQRSFGYFIASTPKH